MRQERVILIVIAAAAITAAGYFAYPLLNHSAPAASAQLTDTTTSDVAVEVVRKFYSAVGDQGWDEAYALLTPAYRKVTSPEALRNAYLRFSTLDADLRADSGSSVIATVKTVDRDGPERHRTFRVTWTVVPVGDGWLIDDKRSETIADSKPAAVRGASERAATTTCAMPTEEEVLNTDWGRLNPDTGLEEFDHRARALSIPDREAIGRAVERRDGNGQEAPTSLRLLKALAKACRLREVMAKGDGPSPMEEIDSHQTSNAEMMYWMGVVGARYALEARGVADPADIAAAYGPYESAIPMSSIAENYHPSTP